jgi:hypothetical protein
MGTKRQIIKQLINTTKDPKVREFLISNLSKNKGSCYTKDKVNSLRLDLIKHAKEEEYLFKAYLKSYNIKYKFKEPLYYDTENGKKFCIVDFYLPEINSIVIIGEFSVEDRLQIVSKNRTLYRFSKVDFENVIYMNDRMRTIEAKVISTYSNKLVV